MAIERPNGSYSTKHAIEYCIKPDPLEALMSRLGSIEVLPEEIPHAEQINWGGYLARTVLRLGDRGKHLYDPDHIFDSAPPIDDVMFNRFKQDLQISLHVKRHPVLTCFPEADPVILNGIARRILGYKSSKNHLVNAIESDDTLKQLFRVIERESKREENGTTDQNVLILAHKGHLHSTGMLTNKIGPIGKIGEQLADVALSMNAWPYIGASTIGTEALETGHINSVDIVDYMDSGKPEFSNFMRIKNPKYVFLSGALSFDVTTLPGIVAQVRTANNRVVVGGVISNLDPEIILKSTTADIFIGEAEGAMDTLLDVLDHAQSSERLVFHRGPPVGMTIQGKYIKVENPKGYTDVFLNLPPFVDMEKYYSTDKILSGNLARRMKLQSAMEPYIKLFGRVWNRPLYAIHEIETSRGCPEACVFCSTVQSQGQRMRRKPVETLKLETEASESNYQIIVDQNFGAKGTNSIGYDKWIYDFFKMMHEQDKVFACQSELAFLKDIKANDNEELRELVPQVMVAMLSGLESPRRVRGAKPKLPDTYDEIMKIAHEMGIVVVGTAITGLPSESFVGLDANDKSPEPSEENLVEWLKLLEPFIPLVFSHQNIPGNAADHNETNFFDYQSSFSRNEDQTKAKVINSASHSLLRIIKRWKSMEGYTPKRKLLATIISLGIWGSYVLGSDYQRSSQLVLAS